MKVSIDAVIATACAITIFGIFLPLGAQFACPAVGQDFTPEVMQDCLTGPEPEGHRIPPGARMCLLRRE